MLRVFLAFTCWSKLVLKTFIPLVMSTSIGSPHFNLPNFHYHSTSLVLCSRPEENRSHVFNTTCTSSLPLSSVPPCPSLLPSFPPSFLPFVLYRFSRVGRFRECFSAAVRVSASVHCNPSANSPLSSLSFQLFDIVVDREETRRPRSHVMRARSSVHETPL